MKISELDSAIRTSLFEYLLRLGDDRVVLGQRMGDWCGHGPTLEEDIALTNITLDTVGHAATLLHLAGEVEGRGRDEDALAYLRDAIDFRNCLMVELPRGDFGFTVVRQFLFSAYSHVLFQALSTSSCEELAAIAQKIEKEVRYHVRYSSDWVVRLGDGTVESKDRVNDALTLLWGYTGELFESDSVEGKLVGLGIAVDSSTLRPPWMELVNQVFTLATLAVPATTPSMLTGARHGRHSEHLGHMLSEMQILPRSHPGAIW